MCQELSGGFVKSETGLLQVALTWGSNKTPAPTRTTPVRGAGSGQGEGIELIRQETEAQRRNGL